MTRTPVIVSQVLDAGPDDPVFDALLLVGPLVVVLVAVLGRSLAGHLLALAYLGTFVGYVLYQGLGTREDSAE